MKRLGLCLAFVVVLVAAGCSSGGKSATKSTSKSTTSSTGKGHASNIITAQFESQGVKVTDAQSGCIMKKATSDAELRPLINSNGTPTDAQQAKVIRISYDCGLKSEIATLVAKGAGSQLHLSASQVACVKTQFEALGENDALAVFGQDEQATTRFGEAIATKCNLAGSTTTTG